MRNAFSLVALTATGAIDLAHAALTPVSGVSASANGWDTRTEGFGCAPSGCVASNVVDDSIEPQSRWSCKAEASGVDACELTIAFDGPSDIVEMRMAFYKGDERTRAINILVDGQFENIVQSSGTTTEYETYELIAAQASSITLQAAGSEDNGWLSITGVLFMIEYELEVSPPSPAPTGDGYVGCFTDKVSDRIMTTVATSGDLTPEACATACVDMGDHFYGLQQGDECWCAGCDLTGSDTNTDYDRHGEDSCTAECTGDSTSTCGGDMAISLFQVGSCISTPAPTPSVLTTECPVDSIQSSLEISLSWEADADLDLWVQEPGGKAVYYGDRLGDVGTMSNDQLAGPGSETYILLNGLSVTNDDVLGNYDAWVTNGEEGTTWLLTTRLDGEVVWTQDGVASDDSDYTRYTTTVTEYAESDCTIDTYGNCPEGAVSSDGLPPCTACPSGDTSTEGATSCSLEALEDIDLPDNIAIQIVADAVGGFAGPGRIYLDEGNQYDLIVIGEDEAGTLDLSGKFERNDGETLPASVALFLYVDDGSSGNDFALGQGEIDPSTGDFTAIVTDIPSVFSRVILSFVVLDPTETPDEQGADTVFELEVLNNGCSNPLKITLEWDTDNTDLDLYVTEPGGRTVYYGDTFGDVGYLDNDNAVGFGPENYFVYNGLSEDEALGDYTVQVRLASNYVDTAWTLTASINGEVEWVEQGDFAATSSSLSGVEDSSRSSRRLTTSYFTFGDDDGIASELFTVTLDSYTSGEC